MPDATRILQRLTQAGQTLSAAESFTGGRLQDQLTDVPGASQAYLGGIIAYHDDAKRRLLGVKAATIRKHGAVSQLVALEMAAGVRRRYQATWALATTGIAGPTGARPGKPVGLSVVALVGPGTRRVDVRVHTGTRNRIKTAAVRQALRLLAQAVAPKRIKRGPR